MKRFLVFLFSGIVVFSIHAEENEVKMIEVTVTVPSGGWKIAIEEVHQVDKELWIISKLTKPRGFATMAISKVSAKLELEAPDIPVKHFVMGKSWGWKNEDPVTFIDSTDSLKEKLAGGKRLFKKKAVVKKEGNTKSVYIVGCRKDLFTDGKTKDGRTLQQVGEEHAKAVGGTFKRVLGIINGYTIVTDEAGSKKLREMPEVKFVERDSPVGV
jgi:hypothetical protein